MTTPDDAALAAETSLVTRTGLPPSATWLRDLFADTAWSDHPDYGGLAAFWQSVHRGIRSEAADLAVLLDRFRTADHDPATFERAFTTKMNRYLGHLEFHHRIEDENYFPRFRRLDARLLAGFELLEADHELIHTHLMAVADSARTLLSALRGPSDPLRRALDDHAVSAETLIGLLNRHLDDEEDLVIPAILRYGDHAVS